MERLVLYHATDGALFPGDGGQHSVEGEDFHEPPAATRSQRDPQWPELDKAISHCRLRKAGLRVLCPVAWLDDPRFLAHLRDAGIRIAILDSQPLEGVALESLRWAAEKRKRHAGERISKGLDLAKRRGAKLGNPHNLSNRAKGSRHGIQRRQRNADARAIKVGPAIDAMRTQGLSYRAIAVELERQQVPTERSGTWTAAQVMRTLARMRSLG